MFDGEIVKCFVCGNELGTSESADPTVLTAVDGGLWFRAYGNYGSTVFDPMPDDGFLRIAICDQCIRNNTGSIGHVTNIKQTTTSEIKPPDIADVPS